MLLHGLLFVGTTKIMFTTPSDEADEPQRNFRIKKLHASLPERKAYQARQMDYVEKIQFEQPAEWQLAKKSYDKFETSKDEAKIQSYDEKIDQLVDARVKDVELKKEEVFRDLSKLKKDPVSNQPKRFIELSKVTEENTAIAPERVIQDQIEAEDFYEKMPGFTPKWNPMVKEIKTADTVPEKPREYKPLISKKSKFTDLKEYIISEILTYEDPETREKYFQINMKVGKDNQELKTIPKEIVFLIDCSKSTTEKRFREFKEGLEYSLQNLNPDDAFNILAFKKFIIDFSPESVSPTPENIQNALKFVDRLSLGTRTDAYNALLKSISRPMVRNPSYIIFLSDGYPTQGITEPSQIIHEVSDTNASRRSIFGFSGGTNVNRYLLDFITYKNRGWSEYSYRSHQIGRYLSALYDKIRDPLLVNVRYHASGLDEEQIYPKLLPDFFRNVEFSLFGRYDDEDEFVLQLVGDVKGKVTEYLVEADLNNAPSGDESIAKNWAFNKIYELIGQLRESQDNTALLDEIEALSRRYKIKTPYLNRR